MCIVIFYTHDKVTKCDTHFVQVHKQLLVFTFYFEVFTRMEYNFTSNTFNAKVDIFFVAFGVACGEKMQN